MRAVTLIRTVKPASVGKTYTLMAANLHKQAVASVYEGVAVATLVPHAAAMAELLTEVTQSTDLVICNGIFRGAGKEEFSIVTEKALRQIVVSEGGDFEAFKLDGKLYRRLTGPRAGTLVGARLKDLQEPSDWLLVDADEPPGFPDEWRPLSLAQRLELLEPIAPGISTSERVELRGSSARIVKASDPPGQASHAWLLTDEGDDLARAAVSLIVHATNADVAFLSPRRARGTGEVVGHAPRTTIDLSTWHIGRLNFDSQPTVIACGYEVVDACITIVNQGAGLFSPRGILPFGPTDREAFRRKTGQKIEISGNGSNLKVSEQGLLTWSTPVTSRDTTKTLREWADGMEASKTEKLRCEAPFRESVSEAAFIHHEPGPLGLSSVTYVYDIGTSTMHFLDETPEAEATKETHHNEQATGPEGENMDMGAGTGAGTQEETLAYPPSAFRWPDPKTIPPRQFLYGKHLIRGFVSLTVSPGGMGKSSLAMSDSMAMISGRNLIGVEPSVSLNVWMVNLEDPLEEMERRAAATALFHGLRQDQCRGILYLDSGRDRELVIADHTAKDGTVVRASSVRNIVAALKARQIDVMIIDPFVSSHAVPENDNGGIDRVAKTWASIAHQANCAIELVHHSKKLGGLEVTVESARGAVSLVSAARSVRLLNPMTKDEAEKAGVEGNPRRYFNVDNGKGNLAPPSDRKFWFHLASQDLSNGKTITSKSQTYDLGDGDSVGVVEGWRWPDAMEGIKADDILKAQKEVAEAPLNRCRLSSSSGDWVGHVIGPAIGVDTASKAGRAKVLALLKAWLKAGMFKEVKEKDEHRHTKDFVQVNVWANDDLRQS